MFKASLRSLQPQGIFKPFDTLSTNFLIPEALVNFSMSANPGGVAASAQLNLDGNGISVAQGGTAVQMYWNSFAIANTSPAPAAE